MAFLFVVEPGSRVKVRRGIVIVETNDGHKVEVSPAFHQALILGTGRASITTSALRKLAEWGVDLVVLSSRGEPLGRFYPTVINRTISSRVEQYKAMLDGRGLKVAKAIVEAKVRNQAAILRYFSRVRHYNELREIAGLLERIADELAESRVEDPREIMEYESRAARYYWSSVASLLPSYYEFSGRDPQSSDPFNMMLNYGYGILYPRVEKALLLVGLDPYAGFMHREKSGRPTLVYDFIEQFRQPAVDKPIIARASRIKPRIEAGFLSRETRREIARIVLENLARLHNIGSRKAPLDKIILRKASELTAYLRGTLSEFKGYRAWW